jgi:hypothetical protein
MAEVDERGHIAPIALANEVAQQSNLLAGWLKRARTGEPAKVPSLSGGLCS